MYQPKKQQQNDLDDYYGGNNSSKQPYDRKSQYPKDQNSDNPVHYQSKYDNQPQSNYDNHPQNKYDKYTSNDNHSNYSQNKQDDDGYYNKNQSHSKYQDHGYSQGNTNSGYYTESRDKQSYGNNDNSYNKNYYEQDKKDSWRQNPDQGYTNMANQSNKFKQDSSYDNYNTSSHSDKRERDQDNYTTTQKQTQQDVVYSNNQNYFDDEIYDYQEEDYEADEDYEDDGLVGQSNNQIQTNPSSNATDGELKILIVAEKNSIAEAISKALGSQMKMKKGKTQCYYFTGQFRGQKASFVVTATNGHVFNRDFPKEYADWCKESIDPLKLFKATTLKRPVPKSSIVTNLQLAAKDCNYLQLWLDNDREGENICFEVEEVCKPYLREGYKTLRAKFSSITSQDLKEAYNSIHLQPNLLESLAVDARQIIDLKIGVAFSRFQTMYFTKKYPALKDKLITYGPCQTPTLGFCVARHEEIQNFKPKVYYQIQTTLQSQSGFKQTAEWEGDRIWQEREAKDLVGRLKQFEYFDVIEATTHQMTKARPEGVNTVNLLKFASSFLGIGPQQTMHVAERLYLSGYLSYPRTESTTYPASFPTEQIIKELQKYETQEISKHASMLVKNGHTAPKAGKDAGDHPPITPTIVVPPKLLGNEKGIYEYIVKMFLAAHSGDCLYNYSKLRVKPSGINVSFKLTGNKTTTLGFTAIASWLAVGDDSFDPQKYITSNNSVLVASVDYRVAQTTPPEHLSESELIGLMEQYGIGTDASMATHINNICERQYVRVEGARRLTPTELGLCLVKGYKKIDAELVAPLLRSNIEKQCDSIAKGHAEFQDVIDKVIATFEAKFMQFRDNISKMDEIFAPKSVLIGKQTQAQKVHKKGAYKRQGGKRGKKQDGEDDGPSHVPIQVTLADFVRPALEAVIQKPKEVQKLPNPVPPKKKFKAKKDDDNLLY